MRSDELYLTDILEAIDAIQAFTVDQTRVEFADSDLVRSAVLQKFGIVGEAAGRVSDDLRQRNPAVPWSLMIGMRNVAIHAYFDIDWDRVWDTATDDIPALRPTISDIIASEYPDRNP